MLGSFLWNPASTATLNGAEITNHDFLEALRNLAFTRQGKVLRPVDYKNLGAEELGGVYESLLALTPQITGDGARFSFAEFAGNERKTSGSYYTPDSLVQCLLDSALDPVVEQAIDGKTAAEAEQAILALKVCDPAVGSGHFLVGAAHRLARHLARVRAQAQGESEPSPLLYQHALRDIIGRCLYGVDINPMAAELCRVSLWLEALEPGKPLSFLDHHIRIGNSLLGATPALLAKGIPDEAFTPIEGDDKEICSWFRRVNKEEQTGQRRLFAATTEPWERLGDLAVSMSHLDAAPDGSIEAIRNKERIYESMVRSASYLEGQFWADAWCAAFVWKKTSEFKYPITEEVFRRIEHNPKTCDAWMRDEIVRFSQQYQFFHWHLAFPDVFQVPHRGEQAENEETGWNGGFDLLLGNPPWERVKLQQEEFFASREPGIAKAKNAAARKKMIAALPATNPSLSVEWSNASRRAESESALLRLSGRYPLGGVGDVNTYAVFADLFRQLTNSDGAAALLLPNGLVTGFTYRAFLRELLESRTLASFYGFENEDKIFPAVHNETKFGILTMTGKQRPVVRPWFTAHLRQPEQVYDPLRRYSLTAEQVEAISPNTLNLPAFRWAADAEVTATIHAAAPVLIRRYEDGRIVSPWNVSFQRMFDMANDSGLFLDHANIAPRIVRRRGASAVLGDGTTVSPLYEGKMLWHFDHRYGTYEGQTIKQANKGVLPHVDDAAHNNPKFRVQPRYWVEADETLAALGDRANREWYFAWRDVGPTERTLVGSVIPKMAVGHTTPLLHSTLEARSFSALIAVLSSLVLDYDARQKSNRMTFFVVEQLALLSPETLRKHSLWLGITPEKWLSNRVLELCFTNVELCPFSNELNGPSTPFMWVPQRRETLQAEIDAAVMHLYSLSRTQAEWILDSFTVLRKYEENDLGEYRTKRVILEIYDAMGEAARTGIPYQTCLEPPPADPRVAHAPSTTQDQNFELRTLQLPPD
ncbi:MAG: Eco57I restriction-modification methylase domain-containing protein [Terracidiphilus sp.]